MTRDYVAKCRKLKCRLCPRWFRTKKVDGHCPTLCRWCRNKSIRRGAPHLEAEMSAAEIDAYLEARDALAVAPAFEHLGRHVFPKFSNMDRARCLKCNGLRPAVGGKPCDADRNKQGMAKSG